MKSRVIYGHVSELTQDERFLEIRDLFVGALRRLSANGKISEILHNKLDKDENQSVHTSR